ncbi:response regulator [Halosimplex sp. TS25]|uniref:response regulator n=1 Tax=Halosimplex rarum TaxID=3396619 RepID=UPI0039ED49E2
MEQTGPIEVVYADGDPGGRSRVVAALEAIGDISVEAVPDGDAVLDGIEEGRPCDCVVSAASLADGTGIELLEAIRERDEHLPFVLYPRERDDRLAAEVTAYGAASYLPRPLDDGVDRLFERVTDATGRYRRQQRVLADASILESAMTHLPYSIYAKDADGRHVRASDWLVASVPEDPIGKTDRDLYGVEESYREDLQVVEEREPLIGLVERHEYSEDHDHWSHTSKVPWVDDDGDLRGLVGITRDITHYQERIQDLTDRLADHARKQYPLTVALGYLKVARQPDSDTEAVLDEIERALREMDEQIDAETTGSDPSTGMPSISMNRLRRVARTAFGAVETGDVALANEVPEGTILTGDGDQLRELLEVLFAYCAESADARAEITVGHTENGFYVEGRGSGLPSAQRDERVGGAGADTAPADAGPDLAVVNRVADAHGWTVTVTDGPAGETRFGFDDCHIMTPFERPDPTDTEAVALTDRTDVGNASPPGSAAYDEASETWVIDGGGRDVWGDEDEFYFVHGETDDDISVSGRLVGYDSDHRFGKLGLMVRGGLGPDAPFYYVGLTEAVGTEVIRRTAAGEKAWGHVARARASPPCWYRIDRSGDIVMAYDSEDGSEWRPIGRQRISFDGPISVGLVVCSRFPGERCRSTFDQIQALELSGGL